MQTFFTKLNTLSGISDEAGGEQVSTGAVFPRPARAPLPPTDRRRDPLTVEVEAEVAPGGRHRWSVHEREAHTQL